MKRIINTNCRTLCCVIALGLMGASVLPLSAAEFIRIDGNKFMAGDAEYKAVGMCNYPFSFGNLDYITRTTLRAKAAGVTLIRACMTWDNDYSKWNDEQLWLRTDWLLKVCAENNMRVMIDLSGYRDAIQNGLNKDAWAAENYSYWDDLVDFVTARQNAFTGIAYKNDPTIFQWLISGEPVPFGFTGDIHNHSRDVNVIVDHFLHVAARLKLRDTNHLVSTGGLLHMNVPLDRNNQEYWKTLWSSPDIDSGAIHIYLNDYTQLPGGSWNSLAAYKSYCDTIGKPFILEEWGIDIYTNSISVAENYYEFGFDAAWDLAIPVTINWDWAPSGGFSVFPGHGDSLLAIVSANAARWGYAGPIGPYTDPPIIGDIEWDFESGTQGFFANNYGGNNGAIATSPLRATSGLQSLRLPVSYETTSWDMAGVAIWPSRRDWSAAPKVAMDVWAPEGAMGLTVKFRIENDENGWKGYSQTGGVINNWLTGGQWNTIYANLDSPYAMDWSPSPPRFDRMVALWIEVHHAAGAPPLIGDIFIDNIRLGDFEVPDPEPLGLTGWMLLGETMY